MGNEQQKKKEEEIIIEEKKEEEPKEKENPEGIMSTLDFKHKDIIKVTSLGYEYSAQKTADNKEAYIRALRIKDLQDESKKKELHDKLETIKNSIHKFDNISIDKILGSVLSEKYFYFITPYYTNKNLKALIRKKSIDFNEKNCALVAYQILLAMLYCSTKNIYNLKIKPSRIYIQKKTDIPVKIRIFNPKINQVEDILRSLQNKAKFFIGYEPPELLDVDLNHISEISEETEVPEITIKRISDNSTFKLDKSKLDIFRLGIITYEMLKDTNPLKTTTYELYKEKFQKKDGFKDNFNFDKVSELGKNFVLKCIDYDPSQRFTIENAMNDEWFKFNKIRETLTEVSISEIKKMLVEINQFKKYSKFIQKLSEVIIDRGDFINTINTKINAFYCKLDDNNNGTVTKQEFEDVLNLELVNNKSLSDSEIRENQMLIKNAIKALVKDDKNKNEEISFKKFEIYAINKEKLFKKENIIEAFKHLLGDSGENTIPLTALTTRLGFEDAEIYQKQFKEVDEKLFLTIVNEQLKGNI